MRVVFLNQRDLLIMCGARPAAGLTQRLGVYRKRFETAHPHASC
jgi:hypothetical protein